MKTLLDIPRGAAKVVLALAHFKAKGFAAADYAAIAKLCHFSTSHAKTSVTQAQARGLVTVKVAWGQGQRSTVTLTEKGAALAIQTPSVAGQ